MGRYKLIIANASVFCLACGIGEGVAYAVPKPRYDNPTVNRVVDAIYKAEGGSKTRHPYGILSVKTTNPRQTCYEVVNWRYLIWSSTPELQKESFVSYLSKSYAPRHVENDPTDLNRHWIKNVSYFLGVA